MNFKIKNITYILIILVCSCSSRPIYNDDTLPQNVDIKKDGSIYSIIPICYEMTRAMIFYPGGLVDPESYIPLMSKIANEVNIAIFIQTMPFNLAIFGENSANKILKKYDYISEWYISGHSLGGVIATSYIFKNRVTFDGLILLASYPMEKKTLSDIDISVLSISASEDLLVPKEKITSTKKLLPNKSQFKVIKGGNHAQFGSYGPQKDDGDALISEERQHNIIVNYIADFMLNL